MSWTGMARWPAGSVSPMTTVLVSMLVSPVPPDGGTWSASAAWARGFLPSGDHDHIAGLGGLNPTRR